MPLPSTANSVLIISNIFLANWATRVLTRGIRIQIFVLLLLPLNNAVLILPRDDRLCSLRGRLDMAFPGMCYTPPSSLGRAREQQRRKEACPPHVESKLGEFQAAL